jgi:Tol biopolymer transport system component
VIRLGDGSAAALSPDGSMALAILFGAEQQLVMLPTGAGETRTLPRHDIADFLLARWVPDGKRIVFVGKKFGEPFRCYLQDVAGGEPRAIQSHDFGIRGAPVSPDSQRLALVGPDRKIVIAPLEGGTPEPVAGSLPGDVLIRWTGDGQALFVYQPGEVPARIHKLSLQTGQREPWMDVLPFDPAGVSTIGQIRLTPDGTSCVYSYKRTLSELFLVQGLV